MEDARFAIDVGNIPQLQSVLRDINEDINTQLEDGETLLHVASKAKNPFIIQLLINKKADVNRQNSIGTTPLHYAVSVNYEPSIQVLLRLKGDINSYNDEGFLPIHEAVKSNSGNAMQLILQRDIQHQKLLTFDGRTILHIAAALGHVDILKYLLQNGSNVNDISEGDGQTCLHTAVENHQYDIIQYLFESSVDMSILNVDNENIWDFAKKRGCNNEMIRYLKQFRKSTTPRLLASRTPTFSPRSPHADSPRKMKKKYVCKQEKKKILYIFTNFVFIGCNRKDVF